MEFKIIGFSYENTGGGCMVLFATAWLPEEDRTIFVHTNGEGCSFWTVDAYHGELDDVEPFDMITAMDNSGKEHKYFELGRECMRRFLYYDGSNRLPYVWLPDKVQSQVTADYEKWIKEEYGIYDPLYEADENKLYMDESYLEVLSEQARKRAAEEAAAMCAELERAEAITAFANFKRAYQDVICVWNKNRCMISDILVTHYPFDESFDELEIATWCDDVIHGLISGSRNIFLQ